MRTAGKVLRNIDLHVELRADTFFECVLYQGVDTDDSLLNILAS